MANRVKLSELANMSLEESDRVLGELVTSAKGSRNGQRAMLDARIKEFELRYEISSERMREGLKAGSFRETAEIARWLMLLAARDNNGPRT